MADKNISQEFSLKNIEETRKFKDFNSQPKNVIYI